MIYASRSRVELALGDDGLPRRVRSFADSILIKLGLAHPHPHAAAPATPPAPGPVAVPPTPVAPQA